MMDHVAHAGHDHELAAGHVVVESPRLAADIGDLVVPTGDDHDGQVQIPVMRLQLDRDGRHHRGIFR